MDINKFTPKNKLKNTSIKKLTDISIEDIYEILYSAKLLKNKLLAKEPHNYLKNKTIAILNMTPSKKSVFSLEMSIRQMGGECVYFSEAKEKYGSILDTANIIKNYGIDGAVVFANEQSEIEEFERISKIPTITGITSFSNPCQVLSDLFTIWEIKGKLSGLKIAYFGSDTNTASSLLIGGVKCGMEICFACPKSFEPNNIIIEKAMQYGEYTITNKPLEAIKNADIVYTDKWPENENSDKFLPFRINSELFSKAKPDALFMHPLPARRGVEVTPEIIDGDCSLIYQQAENKLHTQKAILSLLIK